MRRLVSLTPAHARALFDSLQLARSFCESRLEAAEQDNAPGRVRLNRERLARIESALDTLGAELQDIAEPTYQECT